MMYGNNNTVFLFEEKRGRGHKYVIITITCGQIIKSMVHSIPHLKMYGNNNTGTKRKRIF